MTSPTYLTRDVYESFSGPQVTEPMLASAAAFFSTHYGIWSPLMGSNLAGNRVRMSATKLRTACFPVEQLGDKCTYVRASVDGEPAGHVFACEWLVEDRPVLWITQLVVHARFRGRGIAKTLLRKLRQPRIRGYGIVSSHAHAIMAAAAAFGRGVEDVSLEVIRECAEWVMAVSPIQYVRDAKVHGSLFGSVVRDGAVSTVDTKFLVDHAEPERALELVKEMGVEWPFGGLPDGHEFLLFMEPRSRTIG